jgi:hypothetical protein
MKQSNFDKWLTTEPTHAGMWALIDEVLKKQTPEINTEVCSCYGWCDTERRFLYSEDCEVHG